MSFSYSAEDCNLRLMRFVDRSPCSYFAVSNLKEALLQQGFLELEEQEPWTLTPGGSYFVCRNGSSLISFRLPADGIRSFHVIASHSDSPSFKIKPGPALRSGSGLLRASTEKYGGPIDSTWFDRPLSVSGRVLVEENGGISARLVYPEKLTMMLPSVAPHLLRKEHGSEPLDTQDRMYPVIGCSNDGMLMWSLIAEELKVFPEQILSSDLYLCNREKARIWGTGGEFLSAPRLDDLASCYGSFLGFLDSGTCSGAVAVHAVFDNEEIGSRTQQGADSGFLRVTLERICSCTGLDREAFHRAVAGSLLISADNAHALHPSYEHLSDPENHPCLNHGLVVKYQAAQRYATDGISAALFQTICRLHGIPYQTFTNRQGSIGGSTLGHLSVSQIPLRTADIGLPQLAMHSCYETMGTADTASLAAFSAAFYGEPLPEIR